MILKRITLLFTLIYTMSSFAQEDNVFKKNIVYGNLAIGGTLNYERTLLTPKFDILNHINLHVGVGQNLGLSGGSTDVAHVSIMGVSGMQSHHFIYGIGIGGADQINETWYNINMSNYYYNIKNGNEPGLKPERYYTYTAFKLGYRYLKPGGRFMFNVGVSFPELVFVGAGFAF